MRKYSVLLTIAFALCFVQGLSAQNLTTTDVPRILSYQGHITNADQSVTGVHPITIRLYTDPDGKHKLWEDTYTTDVKDGIFSLQLGTNKPLPTTERLNRPVWLGVSIEGTDELRPLTQFTTAPYALNVPDRSITKEKLSEDLLTLMTKPIGGQKKQTWDLANGGTANTSGHNDDFIGGGRRNFIVNNATANRQANVITGGDTNIIINGTYDAAWSTICGGAFNTVSSYGAFIGGGMAWTNGNVLLPNHVASGRNSFIGGGSYNTSSADYATIVGGELNIASGDHSFIGGGGNTVGNTGNTASGIYSSIVGGQRHRGDGDNSFIGGGDTNIISRPSDHSSGAYSTIGGGAYNEIQHPYSFIGGGKSNRITDESDGYNTINGGESNSINDTASSHNFIGGGEQNVINIDHGVIGGGSLNQILSSASGGGQSHHAMIAGGKQNLIDTASPYTVIVGGLGNTIFNNSRSSAIGGGDTNLIIDFSTHSTIAGGWANTIDAKGTSNTIGGGHCNWMYHGGPAHEGGSVLYATIGGGYQNRIWRSTSGFIGGGYINKTEIDADYGMIGGGYKNLIDSGADYSAIGGGYWNKIKSNYGSLVGGYYNRIDLNSDYASLGGGYKNIINSSAFATIAGGCNDTIRQEGIHSAIGGGCSNAIADSFATIAGGSHNLILGDRGSIGGGSGNIIDAIDRYAHASDNEARFGTIGGGSLNIITKIPLYLTGLPSLPLDYTMPFGATIGGGIQDTASGHFSTVSGGVFNRAVGLSSAIPGGLGLIAYDYQTVVGKFNTTVGELNHFGPSTTINTVLLDTTALFVVGGGFFENSRVNLFEVVQEGAATVFGEKGTGGAYPNGNPGRFNNTTQRQMIGTTYSDNVILAWGDIDPTDSSLLYPHWFDIKGDFGTFSVRRLFDAVYRVEVFPVVPHQSQGVCKQLFDASITVTPVDDFTQESSPIGQFAFATTSDMRWDAGIGVNYFIVRTYSTCADTDPITPGIQSGCIPHAHRFMFKVTGR